MSYSSDHRNYLQSANFWCFGWGLIGNCISKLNVMDMGIIDI